MQRQKQVKSTALLRMEIFLSDVFLRIKKEESFSLDEVAADAKIGRSAVIILKRCKIVEQISPKAKDKFWQWIFRESPSPELALFVIDRVNEYNGNFKKQTQGISQDETFEQGMSTNIDAESKSLKSPYLKPPIFDRPDNPLFERETSKDPAQINIFESLKISVSEKIYIAGCISSGIYSKFGSPLEFSKQSPENIEDVNTAIERAAKDLINKIYSPVKTSENE